MLKHVDWYVMYQLDSYFDLTSQQKKDIRPFVDETLNWIKLEKKAEINQYLADAKEIWVTGPTELKLISLIEKYDIFRVTFFEQIAEKVGLILAGLSDAQLDHLSRKLSKSNKDSESLLELSPEKFERKQRKKILKNLGDWIDDFSDEQEAAYLVAVPIDRTGYQKFFDGRKIAQENFVNYLRTRKSPAEIASMIRLWAQHPNRLRDEPDNFGRSGRMVSAIIAAHKIADEKQRAQVTKRISELQSDLSNQ